MPTTTTTTSAAVTCHIHSQCCQCDDDAAAANGGDSSLVLAPSPEAEEGLDDGSFRVVTADVDEYTCAMMRECAKISDSLRHQRHALAKHPCYSEITSLDDLKHFMECHVYAVWDFMSLLKALQINLTCVSVPWLPPQHEMSAEICRFVNEIVLDEESDRDEQGKHMSHLVMYIKAMEQVGADTRSIHAFLNAVRDGTSVSDALVKANAPTSASKFVMSNMRVLQSNSLPEIAATFTFGREDIIPVMFETIENILVDGMDESRFSKFMFYLRRHIELDGDEHGPLSLKLVASVCEDDDSRWGSALRASVNALTARITLWDDILIELKKNKSPSTPTKTPSPKLVRSKISKFYNRSGSSRRDIKKNDDNNSGGGGGGLLRKKLSGLKRKISASFRRALTFQKHHPQQIAAAA